MQDLPDLRELWSHDDAVVQRAVAEVIDSIERDPFTGIKLLCALADVHRDHDWPCKSLEQVMTSLEQLAHRHEYIALLLMLSLSLPAGSSPGCYVVYDAIALWIDGAKNPRVTEFLQRHQAFADTLTDYIKPSDI